MVEQVQLVDYHRDICKMGKENHGKKACAMRKRANRDHKTTDKFCSAVILIKESGTVPLSWLVAKNLYAM